MKILIPVLVAILALTACNSADVQTINVVPYPNEVTLLDGNFDAKGADISFSEGFDQETINIINCFGTRLSLASGSECSVSQGAQKNGVIFIYDANLPEEAYSLNISKTAVTVKASSLRGVNYAVQTLKQMLPVEIYGKVSAPEKAWVLPCCEINDAPRFAYRGLHMDVSRHFFDMDMVKKYLDIMEVHKLNKLHWHLTDDQGWRIEIKQYPELTEKGSIRKETLIGHLHDSDTYDGTPYGEGCWFSQEQIKEIIAYAAAKGIDIIPEIDLPGHMLAALAAYPELGCTGGPYEVWGRWGVSDEVLCAGNENTMVFLENVLTEVAELFPYEYIHIGGDECPKVYWEKCPKCQAKIKELGLKDTEEFQAEHYLQSYVMTRMTNLLEAKGKTVIGWDEILEGEIAENAVVMSWRGTEGGLKAAKMGHDVIMTPNSFYYLDYYQAVDKENEPLSIGGYLPIEKCYSFEPYTKDMTDEEKAHILGVQANLWTEYIATNEHLEYMLLPRMAALSEVQWCQSENKDWKRFVESADDFCGIYEIMGYNYATHIFNAKGKICVADDGVKIILEGQGDTPIRYTLDGSQPGPDSPVYTEPIAITGSCTLKARSDLPGKETRIYEKTFEEHKAMGRPAKILTQPHPDYTYDCPSLLTDGSKGKVSYNSGDYAGWYNQPFEAVIKMEGETYNSVTLSTFVYRHDYVFEPTRLVVSTSDNEKDFVEVASEDYAIEGDSFYGNGYREFSLSFPETSAKYLKITADCIKVMPDWHHGKGKPGFIFIDEIIVK